MEVFPPFPEHLSTWTLRSYPLDSTASTPSGCQQLGREASTACSGVSFFEAGLKFLYQDQIVTYLVLRDGAQGLTQAQQCSAAELHPDLQFPPSNSDFVFSLVCVSFKHTAGISSLFR